MNPVSLLRKFTHRSLSISYGITVCNEAAELRALLAQLLGAIDPEDEVIVLRDMTRADVAVAQVLAEHSAHVRILEAHLNGDFATFKNRLFEAARGDYLFQIDADELPTPSLLTHLKPYLRAHPFIDCVRVPRINLISGVSAEQIVRWGWKTDARGYINYPDYQPRIAKNNGRIHWKNKVHEKLTGYWARKSLPHRNETYCLLHIKTGQKQEQQNRMYEGIAP